MKKSMLYFDVMLNGMFVFQLAYMHCSLFALDMEDVLSKVYEKRPSLAGKSIELYETKNIVK